LDFTAEGGKRQGCEVPQSLRVKPGAKHPVWKTQSKGDFATSMPRELSNKLKLLRILIVKNQPTV
jgi:hypothetical protein